MFTSKRHIMRKPRWLVIALFGSLLVVTSAHAQQTYPTRPIRLIMAFPSGGAMDIVARVMSRKLGESFRTSVIVDNRAGAGGAIRTEIAVRANPDGYTMILVEGAYAGNAAFYKLPYDPLDNVTPIALIGETGFIVTLHPSVPVKTVKDLIAYDRSNPGKLNYGSGGTGSIHHIIAEFFNQMAGAKLTHASYNGVGLALNDLLGGQIQLIIGGMPPMLPHVRANRLRGIAVTTATRSNAAPELSTVAEAVPGYEATQWFALLGPKARPPEIVARWNSEIDRIVQLPEVRERMAGDGVEPVGGPPERLRQVLTRDIAKWQNVGQARGHQAWGTDPRRPASEGTAMKIRSLVVAVNIGCMFLLVVGIAAEAAELKVLSASGAVGHGRPRAEVRARDRTQARDHVATLGATVKRVRAAKTPMSSSIPGKGSMAGAGRQGSCGQCDGARPLRHRRGRSQGRSQARHLVARRLETHAARREVDRLCRSSERRRERHPFRQGARSLRDRQRDASEDGLPQP